MAATEKIALDVMLVLIRSNSDSRNQKEGLCILYMQKSGLGQQAASHACYQFCGIFGSICLFQGFKQC